MEFCSSSPNMPDSATCWVHCAGKRCRARQISLCSTAGIRALLSPQQPKVILNTKAVATAPAMVSWAGHIKC